ncbi:hypothetical protein D3C81_2161240 [compost metagenome]
MGIVDYFFIYELLVSLSSVVPLFLLELGPIVFIILAIITIRGVIKYIQRKAKENKHLLII